MAHARQVSACEIWTVSSAQQFDKTSKISPREQSRVLHILIKSVDYDGKKHQVGITLRPTGITSLAPDAMAGSLGSGAAA